LSLDDSPPIVKLQWGRARASAEMTRFRRLAVLPLSRLQWGRARASAEIKIGRCARWQRSWSFNGAGLVRARKFDIDTLASCMSTRLQWGRARASAEIHLDGGRGIATLAASMGPRSCERGNDCL